MRLASKSSSDSPPVFASLSWQPEQYSWTRRFCESTGIAGEVVRVAEGVCAGVDGRITEVARAGCAGKAGVPARTRVVSADRPPPSPRSTAPAAATEYLSIRCPPSADTPRPTFRNSRKLYGRVGLKPPSFLHFVVTDCQRLSLTEFGRKGGQKQEARVWSGRLGRRVGGLELHLDLTAKNGAPVFVLSDRHAALEANPNALCRWFALA